MTKGALYLVGTGPGDPELLTLKAARLLGAIKIVAFPAKAGEPSTSYAIAQRHLNAAAELMPLEIPMAVERGPAQRAYDGIATALEAKLATGDVAYLCEGDPLFYGSAMYLLARLSAVAEIRIIPGVTALTAAAAAIRRPLAARTEILKVLPAPLADDVLRGELRRAEAAAIIKVGRHFGRVRALLEETGHAAAATIVAHASGDRQRITPLHAFTGDALPYFATILCYRGGEAWGA